MRPVLLCLFFIAINVAQADSWLKNKPEDPPREPPNAALQKASTHDDKELAILDLEVRLDGAREQVSECAQQYSQASDNYANRKSKLGWYPSEADRATLRHSEEEKDRAHHALVAAQRREEELMVQLRPMYGIVSASFYEEQRNSFARSLTTIRGVAYDQAWYTVVMEMFRAESLSEAVTQALFQWFAAIVIMYPFAVAKHALWDSPWALYAYSSSVLDVPVAIVVWAVSLLVAIAPLAILFGGLVLVVRNAKNAQQQQHRHVD